MNNKEFITAVAGYVDKYASAYGFLSVLLLLHRQFWNLAGGKVP